MDYRRDPLLAVDRALREATPRYEQRPTPEHARGATAYEALAAAQPIPVAAPVRVALPSDGATDSAGSVRTQPTPP